MCKIFNKINKLISSDHSYMTLAACHCLPLAQQDIIKREVGLLIRYFCELPDSGWSIFGTLGEWEINNHFSYDIRRDLNASSYLDWNPVTGSGKRFGHDSAGSRQAIPFLLNKAVQALQAGKLRDGLALTGATCHYFQDAVTFPEQQTLHRRSMEKVLEIATGNYTPVILFENANEINEAIDNIYVTRIKPLLAEFAGKIRQAIFDGDSAQRNTLHNRCDLLGAHITSDILHTVLKFYSKPENVNEQDILEEFNNIDEEGIPKGYFIDRDNNKVFQGYAALEGNHPRGFDYRLTPGLQLRLSATGTSEVRWKQSIVNSILTQTEEYYLKADAYTIDCTGNNGLRILLYDDCWSVIKQITVPFENGNGWKHIEHRIKLNEGINAIGMEFFSKMNSGTILLDNWQIFNAAPEKKKSLLNDKKIKLSLKPCAGYYHTDTSSFGNQNEPITSIRNNVAACISNNDEFVFDGKSFIEIPWHPVYAPLQINEFFELKLMLYPENTNGEIMMSAVPNRAPMSGWRLFIKNSSLCVAVYNKNSEYILEIKDAVLELGKWHSIIFRLNPKNEVNVSLNEKTFTGKADFPRLYSNAGHFIGSCAGVTNFLTGRIKNLQIHSA
jgi:hypothetical protein